jgi:hypothetical protein
MTEHSPKIDTLFSRLLGIDYPIVGAPMFLVSYENLTAAVSEAGGLGMFPLPNYRTTKDLEKALARIREMTDRPIGVNIHLSGRFEWKEQLALCLKYGVRFFITSLGDPRLILEQVHAENGLVFADVIKLSQAERAREKGVDGLVAVAASAGGHSGTSPTMVLVPYLIEKTGLPVLAAGGISTGRQLAAALAWELAGLLWAPDLSPLTRLAPQTITRTRLSRPGRTISCAPTASPAIPVTGWPKARPSSRLTRKSGARNGRNCGAPDGVWPRPTKFCPPVM